MDEENRKLIGILAKSLLKAKHVVALTGAGHSTGSGIPAFRGKDGLWTKYDPAEYAHIQTFHTNPEKVWVMQKEFLDVMLAAKPNAGHYALAELEKMGILKSVITQNVDGFHGVAGNENVIEFHGNKRKLVCLSCGKKYPSEVYREECPPRCECGPILKPDVVLFGEQIPVQSLTEALSQASKCDLMLVIGTSAVVSPASEMPVAAKRAGASVVEINLEVTPLTGFISDYIIEGDIAEILPALVEEVKALGKTDGLE